MNNENCECCLNKSRIELNEVLIEKVCGMLEGIDVENDKKGNVVVSTSIKGERVELIRTHFPGTTDEGLLGHGITQIGILNCVIDQFWGMRQSDKRKVSKLIEAAREVVRRSPEGEESILEEALEAIDAL